jgi:hypothetical protein
VQSKEFAINRKILPAPVPASNSRPNLSMVNELILPSSATSLSSDHLVSLPVSFLTFPSPDDKKRDLPNSFKFKTPLFETGIAALNIPPWLEIEKIQTRKNNWLKMGNLRLLLFPHRDNPQKSR